VHSRQFRIRGFGQRMCAYAFQCRSAAPTKIGWLEARTAKSCSTFLRPSRPTRHPRPSPTGGVADFDEKDPHRRVQEAIPHRPLGTAPAPIGYERAGLPQLSEQRIFEAVLLARVCIVEKIATESLAVWVCVAALYRRSLHLNPSDPMQTYRRACAPAEPCLQLHRGTLLNLQLRTGFQTRRKPQPTCRPAAS
jgi:hypothetical protein